ncbi:hypothetical protein LCGC14_2419190 [marine sediment metagenome]|uniref:Uncharacterized protein n=1 Tax=marine sediment metagenome TaxID=412755 RepID=A0A0F9BQ72_9ZZZZ
MCTRYDSEGNALYLDYKERYDDLSAVNAKLLAALKRSAETFHGLSDDMNCLCNLFRECPNPHCKRAFIIIEEAIKGQN